MLEVPLDFFSEPQTFWCDRCGLVEVKSEDKSTGRFFMQRGHMIEGTKVSSDDGPCITYALCAECLKRGG